MEKGKSAEGLHSKGQALGMKTDPKFVNKGTSPKPLASLSDMEQPEVSKSATAGLRAGMMKN